MSIWLALLFMAIGGGIVEIFELHAWSRYRQGKREGETGWQNYGLFH